MMNKSERLKSIKKKHLMVNDYTLDKVLDKIKRIGTEKLADTKISIDTDHKLPNDTTLQNAVMLVVFVMKDGDKSQLQLFSEEELYDEQIKRKALIQAKN